MNNSLQSHPRIKYRILQRHFHRRILGWNISIVKIVFL